jgi:hypothetical protein
MKRLGGRQKLTPETWEWTPQREKAALAVASEKTIVAAAEVSGVSRETIYQWQRIPQFEERVQEHLDDFLRTARRRAMQKLPAAIEKVIDVMEYGNNQYATRLAAAKDILDRGGFKPVEKQQIDTNGEMTIRVVYADGDQNS